MGRGVNVELESMWGLHSPQSLFLVLRGGKSSRYNFINLIPLFSSSQRYIYWMWIKGGQMERKSLEVISEHSNLIFIKFHLSGEISYCL